jgi:tetratricopeptide (TPR) repeat protein
LEVHRFLGRHADAVGIAQELVQLYDRSGQHSGSLSRAAERLTHGEPLCRVVCVRDDDEFELEDVQNVADGRYEFHFRRNRIALQKSAVLVEQGNALASNAQYAEALDKYREASDVDPYDPDPVYQSGCCLLDLGSYRQAKEAFEEVERLAPGWFRCRSDAWIADGLVAGTVSEEQYRLLRLLEDGQPSPKQALKKVQQGIERSPDFAPFYLVLGNLRRHRNENEQAIAAYRKGLELVAEPDLETRLICALAAALPPEQPERRSLLQRAIGLKGNLVAIATVRLMALQDEG